MLDQQAPQLSQCDIAIHYIIGRPPKAERCDVIYGRTLLLHGGLHADERPRRNTEARDRRINGPLVACAVRQARCSWLSIRAFRATCQSVLAAVGLQVLPWTRHGAVTRPRGTVWRMVSEATITDAARRLAAAACSPARVLLFGSRARRDAREDSDLDFLVIEERFQSKLSEMVRLRDALPPLGVPVDVVVVSEYEAARRGRVPGTLVYRALREGRVLAET